MWGGNSGKDKSSKKLPIPQCCRVAVACEGQHLQHSPPRDQCRVTGSAVQTPPAAPAEPPRKDDVQGSADEGRSRACHPLENKVCMGENRPARATHLPRKEASAAASAQHAILPGEILAQQGQLSCTAAGTTSPVSDQEGKTCVRLRPNLLEGRQRLASP